MWHDTKNLIKWTKIWQSRKKLVVENVSCPNWYSKMFSSELEESQRETEGLIGQFDSRVDSDDHDHV